MSYINLYTIKQRFIENYQYIDATLKTVNDHAVQDYLISQKLSLPLSEVTYWMDRLGKLADQDMPEAPILELINEIFE